MTFEETVAQFDKMVRRFANSYSSKPPLRGVLDFEDLYAVGLDALWRAHETFDPERGFALSTYAHHVINSAMLRLVDYWNFQCRRDERFALRPDGFTTLLNGEGAHTSWWEIHCSTDETQHSSMETDQLLGILRGAIDELPERWRRVIRLRMAEHSNEAIGAQLGVTGSRVQQINAKAQRRLREAIEARW